MSDFDKSEYWFESAKYDLQTARAMLETRRLLYVGFMCHQTIEKALKPMGYTNRACQSGKTYVLARKSPKLYMKNPVKVEVKSITTARLQTLYLDERDVELMKGKNILIVDDVISTGESLYALEQLTAHTEGHIVGKMAVLAEGDAAEREDITYLQVLPLFFK